MANELSTKFEEIQEQQQRLRAQEMLMIRKGLESDDPDKLIKAHTRWQQLQNGYKGNEQKSYIFDPSAVSDQMGYKERDFSVGYNTLRRMARAPVINSIIGTRVEQVSAFSEPTLDESKLGFKIQRKRGLFEEEEDEITDEDKRNIEAITEFILNCGNDENIWHGDSFETFLRKVVRDSLTMDQATFEIVRNHGGDPVEFFATDGATHRLASSIDEENYEEGQDDRKRVDGYLPAYVQVYENSIVAEYYPWELCFGIRNQQTDIRYNGYGVSELETMIQIVTWMLYGDAYNGKFFSQGSAPKGILKINGNVNEGRLAEFRQQWMAMVQGVQNAWRTPVLEADKMEWVDLQKNNRDMEFSKWQEYLIKLGCAIYKIDPSEIGFPMQGSADSNPMFEGNNEARLKYSRDKGLRPLLSFMQAKINKYVVSQINDSYEFKFVGLDARSEQDQVELDIKKAGAFMGYKELRKKYNLDPELEEDDFILNPYYMQKMQQDMLGGMESNYAVDELEAGQGGYEDEGGMDPDELYALMDQNVDVAEKAYRENLGSDNPMANDFNKFVKETFSK